MARSSKTSKSDSGRGSFVELVTIVVVAVGLALLIQAFLVKPYRIPSASMEPTLDIGQRVLVNRLGHRFGDPSVGDIVVFHPPAGAESTVGAQCGAQPPSGQVCIKETPAVANTTFIKRVVAGPGDRIRVVRGRVILNGKPLVEPYAQRCAGSGCDFPTTVRVPAGHWVMMGDNRGDSDDSRFWGPVPRKWIIGNAFATYWPPKRIGLL
jgi:signal peptidase I